MLTMDVGVACAAEIESDVEIGKKLEDTAIAAGTVTILAIGKTLEGKETTGKYTVTVKKPTMVVKIASVEIFAGLTKRLSITSTPSRKMVSCKC